MATSFPALLFGASDATAERVVCAGFKDVRRFAGHSHREAWRWIRDNQTAAAVVVGNQCFHPKWSELVQDYYDGTPTNYDCIFMGNQLERSTPDYIVRMPTAKMTAYIMTVHGALLLLDKFAGVEDDALESKWYTCMCEEPKTFIWFCWNGLNFGCDLGTETDTGIVFEEI